MQSCVFVSYCHEDAEWVNNELLARLKIWRVKHVIDYLDFEPGQSLPTAIQVAVSTSDHVLFVVTEAFARSEWTRRELQETIAKDPAAIQRKAIPVVLHEASVPDELRAIVWCDLSDEQNHDIAWRRLCRSLGGSWNDNVSTNAPSPRPSEESDDMWRTPRPKDAGTLKQTAESGSIWQERVAAIRRLGDLFGEGEINWLAGLVWNSRFKASRLEALKQIAGINSSNSIRLLKEIVEEHGDLLTRMEAAEHVAQLDGFSDPDWLLETLLMEEPPQIGYVYADELSLAASNSRPNVDSDEVQRCLVSMKRFAEKVRHRDIRHILISIVAHLSDDEPWTKQWLFDMVERSDGYYYKVHCLAIGLSVWNSDQDFARALRQCDEEKVGKDHFDITG